MAKFRYEDRAPSVGGLIPEGMVALVVLDTEYTADRVASSGNEYINMQMEMVGQYNAVNKAWERKSGGKTFDKLVFTEKAFFKIDNFLSSAGKAPVVGTEFSLSACDVIGWVVYAVINHVEDDRASDPKYKMQAEVSSYITTKSEYHPHHQAVGTAPEPTLAPEPAPAPAAPAPEQAPWA